jgi:protein SCO1/2
VAFVAALSQPQAIGGPFRLVDHRGAAFTEADLTGRPSLLFFGFTHCPDICPTTLSDVTRLLEALGRDADAINAVFVTVDPARDTPDLLNAYLASFHPRLVALTGPAAAVEAMLQGYRVYARQVPLGGGGYTMDHTAAVYLLDRQGRFRGRFDVSRPADAALADLRRYL